MFGYMGYGYGYNPFGTILTVLIWILIIWAIVALIRGGGPRRWHNMNHRGWGGNNALDILKERYAKGEVSKEEYEERKAVLLKDDTPQQR